MFTGEIKQQRHENRLSESISQFSPPINEQKQVQPPIQYLNVIPAVSKPTTLMLVTENL